MNWEPKVGQTQEEWLEEIRKKEEEYITNWSNRPGVRESI